MKVKINGKETEIQPQTVLELLKTREIKPQMVSVEVNEQIIQEENLDKTPLQEGDNIELHHFMGGGAFVP